MKNTKDIGVFAIEFEEAIASGVRRIQLRTGFEAYRLLKQKELMLLEQKVLLNANSINENNLRLKSLIKEKEDLRNQVKVLEEKQALLMSKSLMEEFGVFNGHHLLVKYLPNTNRASLIKIIDELKTKFDDGIIVLIGEENGNYPITCALTKEAMASGLKAGVIVKSVANLLLGSGGGRPDLATGAGKDLSKLSEVNDLVKKLID